MANFTVSLFVVLPALMLGWMSTAGAAPTAEQFRVRYFINDPEDMGARLLIDGEQMLNRARCECGQSIQVHINVIEPIDPAEVLEAFVGVACDVAEASPDGQFRRARRSRSGRGPTSWPGSRRTYTRSSSATGSIRRAGG